MPLDDHRQAPACVNHSKSDCGLTYFDNGQPTGHIVVVLERALARIHPHRHAFLQMKPEWLLRSDENAQKGKTAKGKQEVIC